MSSSDPFDELKIEVETSLRLLQDQLSRAERDEKPTPSKNTVNELLLSLQATREDADLLRSACKSLRRRMEDSQSQSQSQKQLQQQQQTGPSSSSSSSSTFLREREQFCEQTDAELDRIQLVIEDMQRTNLSTFIQQQRQQQQTSKIKNGKTKKPSSVAAGSTNDNDNDGDGDEIPLTSATKTNNANIVTSSSSPSAASPKNGENSSASSSASFDQPRPSSSSSVIDMNAPALVDIRNWDREQALKKIRLRQKRREEDEERTLADLEPKHDGTAKGILLYYYGQFQSWAIDFVDTLTPQQRIGWLAGMTFVVVFLIVALFAHHSVSEKKNGGGGEGGTSSANSTRV